MKAWTEAQKWKKEAEQYFVDVAITVRCVAGPLSSWLVEDEPIWSPSFSVVVDFVDWGEEA